jgi:transposase
MNVEITATKKVLQTLVDGMGRSQELDDLQNFKRCSAVYRYLSGESCVEISKSMASCEETIRLWVHKLRHLVSRLLFRLFGGEERVSFQKSRRQIFSIWLSKVLWRMDLWGTFGIVR